MSPARTESTAASPSEPPGSSLDASAPGEGPASRMSEHGPQPPGQEPSEGPEGPPEPGPASEARHIAIVGFTPSRAEAPYGDPAWELWGMNDLHLQPDVDASAFSRWYDLHDDATISNRPEHLAWLEKGSAGIPTFVWQAREEWPSSHTFPRDAILAIPEFRGYFTNSVSWMLAHAIAEIMHEVEPGRRAPEGSTIAVFGIDMAQSGEYATQRPSCEMFVGVAAGLGISIHLPDTSDLCKAQGLYGVPGSDALRHKLEARNNELRQRLAHHEQQLQVQRDAVMQLRGAIEQNNYVIGVWTQPAGIIREEQPGSSELAAAEAV